MSGTEFLPGASGPLEALLLGVLRAKKAGAWGDLLELLDGPYPERKHGLDALRRGFTALRKRAADELEAAKAEPSLGEGVAEHVAAVRKVGLEVLSKIKRLAKECPPGANDDLAALGKTGNLDGLLKLNAELQERLESLGCNQDGGGE